MENQRRKRIPVYLAGSVLSRGSASEKPPAQTPPLPLEQLEPTANEIKVVSEAFGLERKPQHSNCATQAKKHNEPPLRVRPIKKVEKFPTPREQYKLTRREIAALLDSPGVDSALKPFELRQYRELASGNLSEGELAKQIGMADKVGIDVYVSELETRIIRKALFLGVRLEQKVQGETDTFDRTVDADRAADERDIAASGGAAIGGSIISRGSGKRLDSFERGGKIRTERGNVPDADVDFSSDVDSDDYGEESSA